jgi:ketosteroid isomerase-like protein
MRLVATIGLAGAVTVWTACAPKPPAPDLAGVRAAIGDLSTAVNAGDSTAFFQILATDFEVLPPGAEPLKADAARGLFRELFTQSSPTLDPFTNEEIQVDGDLAVQRYSFRLTLRPKAGGPPATEAGSGLHIWRRVAGKWHLWKDIWTEPAPAPKS